MFQCAVILSSLMARSSATCFDYLPTYLPTRLPRQTTTSQTATATPPKANHALHATLQFHSTARLPPRPMPTRYLPVGQMHARPPAGSPRPRTRLPTHRQPSSRLRLGAKKSRPVAQTGAVERYLASGDRPRTMGW
ncbi:hypothetical protein PMIN06_004616 [Paraphaeosphaeria minitans]